MGRPRTGLAPAMPDAAPSGAQATELARVHEAYLSGSRTPSSPRSVISASWQRARAAGVDPDRPHVPIVLAADDIGEAGSAHPLTRLTDLLRSALVPGASDAEQIVTVTDREGTVLWIEGNRRVRLRAEESGLFAGSGWSEQTAGTNAMGTALALGDPVLVRSAEHFARVFHRWTCAAVPVHDPATGAVFGTINVSGPWNAVHPGTVHLLAATARLAEAELRRRHKDREARRRAAARRKRTRAGHAADGPVPAEGTARGPARPGIPALPRLELRFLGDRRPEAVLAGTTVTPTLRHAELLALLALHPEGLTGDQLTELLYGPRANPVTIRAEVHRLRQELGSLLAAKPYRLVAEVDADFVTVRRALEAGDVTTAVRLYRRRLLPESCAPGVRAERARLGTLLLRSVAGTSDPAVLLDWLATEMGRSDLAAHERLLRLLPAGDPRRAGVLVGRGRLAGLRMSGHGHPSPSAGPRQGQAAHP
ncbi:GAF domain-containing protein [Streptomyces sp. F63]|uniref:GAF domain-containing protein n=1 Tax=Streptomyces sp. F63 TaxID=2824887 RepID=UPI001B386D60|nr:GAF domain-containing protein [Streptomyces sp. F63]MBQ0985989.1 GAF domain-containing protein [Streptomyces sp. F63]